LAGFPSLVRGPGSRWLVRGACPGGRGERRPRRRVRAGDAEGDPEAPEGPAEEGVAPRPHHRRQHPRRPHAPRCAPGLRAEGGGRLDGGKAPGPRWAWPDVAPRSCLFFFCDGRIGIGSSVGARDFLKDETLSRVGRGGGPPGRFSACCYPPDPLHPSAIRTLCGHGLRLSEVSVAVPSRVYPQYAFAAPPALEARSRKAPNGTRALPPPSDPPPRRRAAAREGGGARQEVDRPPPRRRPPLPGPGPPDPPTPIPSPPLPSLRPRGCGGGGCRTNPLRLLIGREGRKAPAFRFKNDI